MRRFGRRALGRFVANWVMATIFFFGLCSFFVLWNGGHSDAHWSRGHYIDGHDWHWPEAFKLALILGLIGGALFTLMRPRHEAHQG